MTAKCQEPVSSCHFASFFRSEDDSISSLPTLRFLWINLDITRRRLFPLTWPITITDDERWVMNDSREQVPICRTGFEVHYLSVCHHHCNANMALRFDRRRAKNMLNSSIFSQLCCFRSAAFDGRQTQTLITHAQKTKGHLQTTRLWMNGRGRGNKPQPKVN